MPLNPQDFQTSRAFNPYPMPRAVYVEMPDGRVLRALVRSMDARVSGIDEAVFTFECYMTRDEFVVSMPNGMRVSRPEFVGEVPSTPVVPPVDDGVPTGEPDRVTVVDVNRPMDDPDRVRISDRFQFPGEPDPADVFAVGLGSGGMVTVSRHPGESDDHLRSRLMDEVHQTERLRRGS
jgi:hypothetical protein